MSFSFWTISAVIIILVLASYAVYLLNKVKQQKEKSAAIEQQNAQNQLTKDINVFESIILIAKAMDQKQCEISEGCWRLSVLIESLPNFTLEFKQQYPAIFKLYESISHMPILDARKELTKKQRLTFDLERMGIEQEMEESVLKDVSALQPFALSIKDSLVKQLT